MASVKFLAMKLLLLGVLLARLLVVSGCGSTHSANRTGSVKAGSLNPQALTSWPRTILWAWQRTEDLGFINPQRVGVSYLVKTIQLKGDSVVAEPNLNGLRVPAGTRLMACARIETDGAHPPSLSAQQAREAATQLASLAAFPDATALQVDFDATRSQWDFYSTLLAELRRRLPRPFPLSITALASWCAGDDWIARLPVDEAVPMLFRMGPDRASILLRLEAGDDFDEPLCGQSAGISTDESVPRLPIGRRLYTFTPRPWTKTTFDKAVIIQE
jgi:hypothetical protein